MAARIRKIRHDENTKLKIKAAQIINRMQDCIMGKIELDPQQVSCGRTLLNKVMPDQTSATIQSDHNITIQVVRFGDNPASG